MGLYKNTFEPDCAAITRLTMPAYIQSLDTNNAPSEAIALNCAVVSGIIADFLQDEEIVPLFLDAWGRGRLPLVFPASGTMSAAQFKSIIRRLK